MSDCANTLGWDVQEYYFVFLPENIIFDNPSYHMDFLNQPQEKKKISATVSFGPRGKQAE